MSNRRGSSPHHGGRGSTVNEMRGDLGVAFGAAKDVLNRGFSPTLRINVTDRQRGEVVVSTEKAPEGHHIIFRKTANDMIDVRHRTPSKKSKRLAQFTPSEIMKGDEADAGLIKDVIRDFHHKVGVSESAGRRGVQESGDWKPEKYGSRGEVKRSVKGRQDFEELAHKLIQQYGSPDHAIHAPDAPSWDATKEFEKYTDDGWNWQGSGDNYVHLGGKPLEILGTPEMLSKIGVYQGESTSRVNQQRREQDMGSKLQDRIAESLDKTSRDPSGSRKRERRETSNRRPSRQQQVESNQQPAANEPSREELRECLDEMTRSYLTAKALLDIPKEEQNDFLESLKPSGEFDSLAEFRSYINTRKREFLGEEDDDEGPGTEDWVHEVAQRIGDVAGWEGVERVDIAPAGIKRPEGVEGTIVRVCKPEISDMPTEKEMESVRAKIRSEFPGVLSIWRGGHSVMFTGRGVSKSVVERSQNRKTLQDDRLKESMEGIPDANKDIGGRIAYLAGYRS